MGASVEYLQRDPNSGRLSYRRPFSPDLRLFIPGKNGVGPRELKRTLAATSLTPDAWARFRAAEAEFEIIERMARQLASGTFHPIDLDLIRFLPSQYLTLELEQDERARFPLPGLTVEDARKYEVRLDPEGDWETSRELLHDADVIGLIAFWGPWVEVFARSQGYIIKPDGQPFADLCRAMAEAACRLWLALERRREDGGGATPARPTPPPRKSKAAPATGKSFREIVVGEVLDSKADPTGAATKQATRTALRFLDEALGDVAPSDLKKAEVSRFREMLAQRPARLPKAHQGLPLPKLVELYAEKADVPRLSPKSMSQHLGMLSAAWAKGQDRGLIEPDLPNPFRFKGSKPPKKRGKPEMTVEEVNAIFRLPLFTRHERPTGCRGEAAYWLPLMLLWTGARPEEVAQLLVSDFSVDPKTKRHLVTFTDEGQHPHKGRRSLKTAKSGTGYRTMPLPIALIDLGLPDYLDALKEKGETALFPELRTRGERGLLFPSFGGWWSAYLDENGVKPAGEGRQPAREFRHVWTTAARESGIPREAIEFIQGHSAAAGSAHEDYGQKDAYGLQIDRWALEGLDLSIVQPWKALGGS